MVEISKGANLGEGLVTLLQARLRIIYHLIEVQPK